MSQAVVDTAAAVQTELLIVTPYLVPTDEEKRLLRDLRRRNVRVRILTNSLESTTDLAAQSGYTRSRVALLKEGVGLYEIRSRLGNTSGSGQTAAVYFPLRLKSHGERARRTPKRSIACGVRWSA